MERQEFLKKLGISLAVVCAGCGIASCGSSVKQDDPKPNPNGSAGGDGAGLFSINTDTDLKNTGEFKISNGVILVRLGQGNTASSFTAVAIACTHQGTSINYHTDQGKFICPNHGSEFANNGTVIKGPATVSLQRYNIVVNGNNLTVTS